MPKEKKEVKVDQPNDIGKTTTNSQAGLVLENLNPSPSAALGLMLSDKKPEPQVKMVQISEDAWNQVQEKLKMLTEVADKGRVFNYENTQPQKKAMKVKLSIFNGGVIVGWRTLKDELIKHPTSGLTVGEKQEYELKILNQADEDNPNGFESTVVVDGYKQFSDARYNERIDANVVGKKEDWNGNFTLEVVLPDGRKISLDSRFVN